jgi:hypothetical protein
VRVDELADLGAVQLVAAKFHSVSVEDGTRNIHKCTRQHNNWSTRLESLQIQLAVPVAALPKTCISSLTCHCIKIVPTMCCISCRQQSLQTAGSGCGAGAVEAGWVSGRVGAGCIYS